MRNILAIALILFATAAHAGSFGKQEPRCATAGCSGQLCVDIAHGDTVSTCEWKPAYACYKEHGVCEAQPDGICRWSPTAELMKCLENPPQGIRLNGGLSQ